MKKARESGARAGRIRNEPPFSPSPSLSSPPSFFLHLPAPDPFFSTTTPFPHHGPPPGTAVPALDARMMPTISP